MSLLRSNPRVTGALRSLLLPVREFMHRPVIKTAIEISNEIAGALVEYQTKDSKYALLKGVGSVALKFIDKFNEVTIWDYFDNPEWNVMLHKEFHGLIRDVVNRFPHYDITTSDENMMIRIHDVDGCEIGYAWNKRLNSVDVIHVKVEHRERAEEIVCNELWKMFGGKSVVMRRNPNHMISWSRDVDRLIFEVDDTHSALHSQLAEKRAQYFRLTCNAGISRSLLLYGPPGTGKSTMARTIVEKLGLRSFRIKLNDIDNLEPGMLFEAIKIFRPNALIVDDLDRSLMQHVLLDLMEHFHQKLDLVIATANAVDNFDHAMLRPGRFDEIEFVEQLDDEVIKKVLGEENMDVYDDVKNWPIVFIEEYKKRRQFMSADEAKNAIIELSERVEQVSRYEYDDELMYYVHNKSKKKTPPRKRKKRPSANDFEILKHVIAEHEANKDDE